MKKMKKNWFGFLLISLLAINPIFLLSACVSNGEKDDGNENQVKEDLLNKIKADINETFKENVLVIDSPFFHPMKTEEIFDILAVEKEKLNTGELNAIDITSSKINKSFIDNINQKLNNLNNKLKNKYVQLENFDKKIVEISSSKLMLENISYNDILDLYQKIFNKNKNNDIYLSTSKMTEKNENFYKVLLKLELNINIIDNVTVNYTLTDLDYYITTNKENIDNMLSGAADFLAKKLNTIKIDLDELTDSNDDNYVLSNQKLEKKIIELILRDINFDNGVSLNIDKIGFINENIRFALPSLRHSNDNGNYYKKFLNTILHSNQNIIDQLLTKNEVIKKLNKNSEHLSTLNIKEFNYTAVSWKLNNIVIPGREINTYIQTERETFGHYLEEFRKFFNIYFELSKAGKIYTPSEDRKLKVMKIDYKSLESNWKQKPTYALWDYYNNVLRKQIIDNNKRYFKMHFNYYGYPRSWESDRKNNDDSTCNSTHWDSESIVTFKFKVFEIKFLDREGLQFIGVCKP